MVKKIISGMFGILVFLLVAGVASALTNGSVSDYNNISLTLNESVMTWKILSGPATQHTVSPSITEAIMYYTNFSFTLENATNISMIYFSLPDMNATTTAATIMLYNVSNALNIANGTLNSTTRNTAGYLIVNFSLGTSYNYDNFSAGAQHLNITYYMPAIRTCTHTSVLSGSTYTDTRIVHFNGTFLNVTNATLNITTPTNWHTRVGTPTVLMNTTAISAITTTTEPGYVATYSGITVYYNLTSDFSLIVKFNGPAVSESHGSKPSTVPAAVPTTVPGIGNAIAGFFGSIIDFFKSLFGFFQT